MLRMVKTIHVFIWWRLVQGLGASGGYFLARTIPADLYQGRALAKVMALVGAINGFAPASAPVIGGLVARSIGWQGIFWILFGFCAFLLLISPVFKESLPVSRRITGHFGVAFKNYAVLCRNRHFVIHVMLKGRPSASSSHTYPQPHSSYRTITATHRCNSVSSWVSTPCSLPQAP